MWLQIPESGVFNLCLLCQNYFAYVGGVWGGEAPPTHDLLIQCNLCLRSQPMISWSNVMCLQNSASWGLFLQLILVISFAPNLWSLNKTVHQCNVPTEPHNMSCDAVRKLKLGVSCARRILALIALRIRGNCKLLHLPVSTLSFLSIWKWC